MYSVDCSTPLILKPTPKMATVSLLVTIILFAVGAESFPLMNLYGYVQTHYNTHFYTYNTSIIGYAARGITDRNGYKSEGIVCLLDSDGSGKNYKFLILF